MVVYWRFLTSAFPGKLLSSSTVCDRSWAFFFHPLLFWPGKNVVSWKNSCRPFLDGKASHSLLAGRIEQIHFLRQQLVDCSCVCLFLSVQHTAQCARDGSFKAGEAAQNTRMWRRSTSCSRCESLSCARRDRLIWVTGTRIDSSIVLFYIKPLFNFRTFIVSIAYTPPHPISFFILSSWESWMPRPSRSAVISLILIAFIPSLMWMLI